jgi:DNA-binding XRE family transcriptional regulator
VAPFERGHPCVGAHPLRGLLHGLELASATPCSISTVSFKTGSLAPSELPPRSLEAGIGAEVRRMRKSLDLTMAELAASSGISAGMLSKIENGAISPSLATLDSLAKASRSEAAQIPNIGPPR